MVTTPLHGRSYESTLPPDAPRCSHDAQPAQRTILVVEIDREHRDQLQGELRESGIMAVATSSELRALELLRGNRLFDAALVEFPAPSTQANGFIEQIRKQQPGIPIVAMLGDDDLSACELASQYGADYSVAKSISKYGMARALQHAIDGTKSLRRGADHMFARTKSSSKQQDADTVRPKARCAG
ncbi:MAG TPA: response regulator [Polyangiaceae bacterium]